MDILHRVQSNLRATGIYLMLIALIVVIIPFAQKTWINQARAEDVEKNNFATLIQELQNRIQEEKLLISLTLHTSITNGMMRITIGEGYEEIAMSIHEIGSDYLCLREIQGAAEIITCLNYNNIAGIDYINN